MTDLSVIICTDNPRLHYLRRVLDALRAQTLPLEQWELLLVDNASSEPLAARVDLTWHPLASHLREPALGLTPARLRGMSAARAPVLVFVDDDNVLQREYLANARIIATEYPQLGAGAEYSSGIREPPSRVDASVLEVPGKPRSSAGLRCALVIVRSRHHSIRRRHVRATRSGEALPRAVIKIDLPAEPRPAGDSHSRRREI